jgi:hypothetical protein
VCVLRAPTTLLDHIDTEEKGSGSRTRVRPHRRGSVTSRESPVVWDDDATATPAVEAKLLTETTIHADEFVLRLFAFANLSWAIPEEKASIPEAPAGPGRHRRPGHSSFDAASSTVPLPPDAVPPKPSASVAPLPAVVDFCEILLSGAEIEVSSV